MFISVRKLGPSEVRISLDPDSKGVWSRTFETSLEGSTEFIDGIPYPLTEEWLIENGFERGTC